MEEFVKEFVRSPYCSEATVLANVNNVTLNFFAGTMAARKLNAVLRIL